MVCSEIEITGELTLVPHVFDMAAGHVMRSVNASVWRGNFVGPPNEESMT
jgi:hypothetical protein